MKSGDMNKRRGDCIKSKMVLRGFKALLQHLFLVQSIFKSNTFIYSGNLEITWTFKEFLKSKKKKSSNLSACAFNFHCWVRICAKLSLHRGRLEANSLVHCTLDVDPHIVWFDCKCGKRCMEPFLTCKKWSRCEMASSCPLVHEVRKESERFSHCVYKYFLKRQECWKI